MKLPNWVPTFDKPKPAIHDNKTLGEMVSVVCEQLSRILQTHKKAFLCATQWNLPKGNISSSFSPR
jgi:hypothetical protein